MTDLVTRYVGTCIVCERHIKVRDSLLVHHGFKRPGTGYIEGDCFGVGYKPHELSNELAKKYLELVESLLPLKASYLISNKENLMVLEQELEKTYNIGLNRYNKDAIQYQNEIYKIKQSISLLEFEIKNCKFDIKRMNGYLNSWSLKPLITFDEEKQIQQIKKDEAAKKRADKKQAKLDAAIKRFQERIDSAYKRNNKEALANIYESIMRKLSDIDPMLSKQDRMRLVDRESVWMELGVYNNFLYYENYNIARDIIVKGIS